MVVTFKSFFNKSDKSQNERILCNSLTFLGKLAFNISKNKKLFLYNPTSTKYDITSYREI